MYPLGHLAAGYVTYSLAVRCLARRSLGDGEVALLLFGTQFPDIIDKPLAWWFNVLPGGRTFAHSIYVTVVVLVVVGYLTKRRHQTALGWAFGFGYVSHLVGDSIYALEVFESANPHPVAFLAWPLTNPIVYVVNWRLEPYLQATALTPTFGWEVVFGIAVCGLWVIDGRPGWSLLGWSSTDSND